MSLLDLSVPQWNLKAAAALLKAAFPSSASLSDTLSLASRWISVIHGRYACTFPCRACVHMWVGVFTLAPRVHWSDPPLLSMSFMKQRNNFFFLTSHTIVIFCSLSAFFFFFLVIHSLFIPLFFLLLSRNNHICISLSLSLHFFLFERIIIQPKHSSTV